MAQKLETMEKTINRKEKANEQNVEGLGKQ